MLWCMILLDLTFLLRVFNKDIIFHFCLKEILFLAFSRLGGTLIFIDNIAEEKGKLNGDNDYNSADKNQDSIQTNCCVHQYKD